MRFKTRIAGIMSARRNWKDQIGRQGRVFSFRKVEKFDLVAIFGRRFWSTPIFEEIEYTEELRQLYRNTEPLRRL